MSVWTPVLLALLNERAGSYMTRMHPQTLPLGIRSRCGRESAKIGEDKAQSGDISHASYQESRGTPTAHFSRVSAFKETRIKWRQPRCLLPFPQRHSLDHLRSQFLEGATWYSRLQVLDSTATLPHAPKAKLASSRWSLAHN